MNNKGKENMKTYKQINFEQVRTYFKEGVEITHPQGLMSKGSQIVETKDVETFVANNVAKCASLGMPNGFKVISIEDKVFEATKEDTGMAGYIAMFGTASE